MRTKQPGNSNFKAETKIGVRRGEKPLGRPESQPCTDPIQIASWRQYAQEHWPNLDIDGRTSEARNREACCFALYKEIADVKTALKRLNNSDPAGEPRLLASATHERAQPAN